MKLEQIVYEMLVASYIHYDCQLPTWNELEEIDRQAWEFFCVRLVNNGFDVTRGR